MADGEGKAEGFVEDEMLYWKWQGLPSAPSVSSAVGFMEKALPLRPGDRVLDLGCGLGCYSLELARRGYQVTGLDISEAFLEVARNKAEAAGVAVEFLHGDMTRLGFSLEFEAVILWGNTFGLFSEEENWQTLAGMRKTLKDGGHALLDTQNCAELPKELAQSWRFDSENQNLLYMTEDTRDEARRRFGFEVTAIDFASGQHQKLSFSWRLYLTPELEELLCRAGLEPVAIYGDDLGKIDWESYESGVPYPYSEAAFTEKAMRRLVVCAAKAKRQE